MIRGLISDPTAIFYIVPSIIFSVSLTCAYSLVHGNVVQAFGSALRCSYFCSYCSPRLV